MTRPLHGSARTSPEVRTAIRESGESLRVLARRFGVDPKTVAKWRARTTSADRPVPGGRPGLSAQEEDIVVRFRTYTGLPLDDCLYALQAQIPHLTRSSLHRCLQRHGVSRLGDAGRAHASGMVAVGVLHIDATILRTEDGAHCLFKAVDHASRFVFVRLCMDAGGASAEAFFHGLVDRLPFRVREVVTLETDVLVDARGGGTFAAACGAFGIVHRVAPRSLPWMRGEGAGIGRLAGGDVAIGRASDLAELLAGFVEAYNFRRRLKRLGGRTPYEFVCDAVARRPDLRVRDPHHDLLGLEIVPG